LDKSIDQYQGIANTIVQLQNSLPNETIPAATDRNTVCLVVECSKKGWQNMPEATWRPHEEHGKLTAHSGLPDSVFAFPKQRKEPLTDAQHVRNAVARFDQVIDVSDSDRALAFANIEKAASYYNVNLTETSWRELGIHPQKKYK
jgi:hypothetical protein